MNNEVDTMHTMKGIGNVTFQLQSGVSLKVEGAMNVLGLSVSLLSVSTLEDKRY